MPKNTGIPAGSLRGRPMPCGLVRQRIEHVPHGWRNVYPPTMCLGYKGLPLARLWRWLTTGW